MRKVTENTFRTYAVEAVKKLNTLEIKAILELTPFGAEISLYRENVKVGHVSIMNGSDWTWGNDFTRDDIFNITPDHKNMKSVFEKLYEVVNSLLDNSWFTVKKEERNKMENIKPCEITDPEYFEEHQEDTEEQIEEKEEEVRTLTVTLHLENEEKEITVTYEDVKDFYHVVGQEALEIEKSTDEHSIDKDHAYIVIEFFDGSEATFRRSSVVRITEKGHVLLERDPKPTPEEADKEATHNDFKPEQDYKEEDSKVEAVAQYLNNKITGWYENTSIYGMSGKFIGCKAEGEHGIRINWEENGKEYTMVINWFTEYPAEQLYNIWMVQDVEVKEVKPEPNKITTQARTYVDDKVQEIRYELTKLEELEEATNVIDAELEKDSENTELDKKWDEAYKEEYQQFKRVYGLVSNLVGIDLSTARQIVNGNRDRLKKILGL